MPVVTRSILIGACFATCAFRAETADSQEPDKKVAVASPFFDVQDPIEVTLTTNIGQLRSDKTTDHPWRAATMSYKGLDGIPLTVPVQARTRGIWRLKTCDFPPLRLNFSGETSRGSIFHKLDKPKLVSYCKDNESSEQYILQEFQLYRIYQLLTPVSHRARLLRVTYADSASGRVRARRYGFVIEEPKAIAARLGGKVLEQTGAGAGDLDPDQNALVGVFQYMIGNTDFSIAGLHNVELLMKEDGVVMPIAYDFDFSGAVNARYATPPEILHIASVRYRLFRGYCTDPASFARAFAVFVEKKPQIYALYNDEIGKLIDPVTVKETLRYFDEFYETINDPRSARRSIIEPCIARP
ncbi:MAG: hypothetical protein QOK07_2761 [Gemmatimonadaceae bacterium]|nr:hypothetical protein [Gemmatimonadaceae bacterium]